MARADSSDFAYQAGTSSSFGSSSAAAVFRYPEQWEEKPRLDSTPDHPRAPRRTPRRSLIVVLPDGHAVSAESLSNRLFARNEEEQVDVIIACAGQPKNLSALQREVSDLQVLVAPAGTSTEDLRELAMGQAPGDIVTLLSGVPIET